MTGPVRVDGVADGADRRHHDASTCAVCGGPLADADFTTPVGPPVGGDIHVTAACLRAAAELIDQELAALRAHIAQPKPNRGLVVSVVALTSLAVLVAAVTFWKVTGWPGAAVALAIGVVAAVLARRTFRGVEE